MNATSVTTEQQAITLPESFNFAAHLLAVNAQRPNKVAFVDDQRSLTYGELDQRVRTVAAGLRALGIRREERVLLLMQDGCDWPVSFLGAMYAGLVPVAVNTLLTADDYAYMLEHSRAQAVLVSGVLLPAVTAAMTKSDHEVTRVIVSNPTAPLHPAEIEFEAFLQSHQPAHKPASTSPDDPGFWLYSSGSTGRPKGTVHSHGNPFWTAELYGKAVLQLTEHDVCFSAAKLFFAYGLGNGLSFPMSVGATTILMGERPTPEATFRRWTGGVGGVKPTVFYGAPTGFAGMLAHPALPAKGDVAMRLVSSAGEALPAELGERSRPTSAWTSWTALAQPRCCTSSCPTCPSAWCTAPRAGRCPATPLSCAAKTASPCPMANRATSTSTAHRRP